MQWLVLLLYHYVLAHKRDNVVVMNLLPWDRQAFRSILLFAILFLLLSSFADYGLAEKYYFKNYTVRDGLPQSDVRTVIQDKRGFIWFTMETGGVARFDGYLFKSYSRRDGIPDITIYSVMEDRNGIVWVGGMGGVACYRGEKFFCPPELEFMKDDIVYSMIEDKNGVIWLGTLYGVVSYEKGKAKRYTEKMGLSRYQVLALCEDDYGNIWMGTNYGLNCFDGKTFHKYYEKDGLNSNHILSLGADSEGRVWIGTTSGLNVYENGRLKMADLKDFPENNKIQSIYEDRNNKLWIGTKNSGVFCVAGGKVESFNTAKGMRSNYVTAVYEDWWGNMWFCSPDFGAMVFSGKQFTLYGRDDGMNCNRITTVFEDNKGLFWFGTKNKGLCLLSGNKFSAILKGKLDSRNVTCMTQDDSGNIFIGTDRGVMKFDGKNIYHLSDVAGEMNISAILKDSDNNIWIGTTGLTLIKYQDGDVSAFDRNSGLGDTRILSIFQDSFGTVWFGTYGELIEYKDGIFKNHQIVEGVIGDYIFDIAEDKCSNLWLGTRGGIVRFSPPRGKASPAWTRYDDIPGLRDESLKSVVTGKDDSIWASNSHGLDRIIVDENCNLVAVDNYNEESFIDIDSYHKASMVDSEGNIWFGTAKGAVKLNTQKVNRNENKTFLHITGLRINFEEQDLGIYSTPLEESSMLPYKLKLPFDKNHITFDFVGISFPFPEKTKYTYKLDGIDNEWSPPTEDRLATYPQLPPGNYTFHLKSGQSLMDAASSAVEFSFVILPPFWKTRWFYFVCSLFFLAAFYALIRLRTYSLARQRDYLRREVESRTEELIAAKEELEYKVSERTSELQLSKEQLRSLVSEVAIAEEKERRRISEGLHDSVSHNLAAAKIRLGVLSEMIADDETAELANGARQLIEEALKESRTLTFELSPPVLYEIGFEAALEWLAEIMNEKEQDIKFVFSGSNSTVQLKTDISISLFKAVRELLVNAAKHSFATEVNIEVTVNCNMEIIISDNGVGFDTEKLKQKSSKVLGFGLFNIRDRADYLGWNLIIDSEKGRGTIIKISVPLDENSSGGDMKND